MCLKGNPTIDFLIWLMAPIAWKVSVFGVILVRIFPHSDWILCISPYSVQMREDADQNNSEYKPSHTVTFTVSILAKWWYTLSALIPCAVLLTILLIIWVARINRYIFVVHVDRKTTYYMYMCDWWETRTLGWCVKIVQYW